jgi:tetratricopeptide (TPR) repeat protein
MKAGSTQLLALVLFASAFLTFIPLQSNAQVTGPCAMSTTAPDDRIAACTDFIASAASDADKGRAYATRGYLYLVKRAYDPAIADLTAALAINPENADTYTNRASAHVSKNEPTLALADYERSLQLRRTPTAFLGRANLYHILKDDDRAFADIDAAILLNPTLSSGYILRGTILNAQGKQTQALGEFSAAIQFAPREPRSLVGRANVYNRLNRASLAVADCSAALAIDPNYGPAYSIRGEAERLLGQNDAALADLSAAIRLNPQDVAAFNRRGIVYQNLGKDDLAAAEFQKVIEINPNFAAVYTNRGNAYLHEQNYDLALADFATTMRLDPKDGHPYFGRGTLYTIQRRYELAMADFAMSQQIDATISGDYARGLVLLIMGNFTQAVSVLTSSNERASNSYTIAWSHVASLRAGTDDAGFVARSSTVPAGWSKSIVGLFLGNVGPAQLEAAATTPQQRCEAALFIGEYQLSRHDAGAARSSLTTASRACRGNMEMAIAQAELARLSQ